MNSSAGWIADQVAEHPCSCAAGRVPVLVGITDTSLVESAGLAQEATELGRLRS